MIDCSVLRGACQECGGQIALIDGNAVHTMPNGIRGRFMQEIHSIKPVWCLSAQQQRVVINSEAFREWCKKEPWVRYYLTVQSLIRILEEEPFLVARILKETKEAKP